jgi:predicted dehydrogenase
LTQLALTWQGLLGIFNQKVIFVINWSTIFGTNGGFKQYAQDVIGAGVISYSHARAVHNLGIDIAEIFDLDQGRAQELASQYGSRALGTLDEVIEEVDMVHILTPPFQRVELVRQAAVAGKHIYIEKPLAGSVDDAREIVALAAENKVKLMTGFNIAWVLEEVPR